MAMVCSAVSAIWDLEVGFSDKYARPTLMNVLMGRAVMGEIHGR